VDSQLWARPATTQPFCAVTRTEHGYASLCNGRFEVAIEETSLPHERCKRCSAELVELLPCPFCGRSPLFSSRVSNHTKTGAYHIIACHCGSCSARAHQHADTIDGVVKLLNTRHTVNVIQPADPDDASDPTWDGEGPRLARQRLERREGK
jgi:transcription elongation factor Elf1